MYPCDAVGMAGGGPPGGWAPHLCRLVGRLVACVQESTLDSVLDSLCSLPTSRLQAPIGLTLTEFGEGLCSTIESQLE